jgi:beta-amylase
LLAYIGTIILVHTHLNLQLATIIYYLRDGCLPIAQMFGRYCCSCFDLRDAERTDSKSSPEGTHRQLVSAAKMCNLSLNNGENSVAKLDDASLSQVVRSSRLYSGRTSGTSFSLNYDRMNKSLFEFHNWRRFTKFMRQMSDARTFLARLDFRKTFNRWMAHF